MAQSQAKYREMKSLTEDEIIAELLSDPLSDVPEDIFSDSECESDDSDITKEPRKIVRQLPHDSDSESSDEFDDDDMYNLGVTKWAKRDETPNRYTCVLIPHAPGAAVDLANNKDLGQIILQFIRDKKLICAIGLGVAGLLSAQNEENSTWGLKSYSLTGARQIKWQVARIFGA
ncbi:hypothetical protein C0J52_15385 [Blattella germanica]|nr:hypothetical protein C0J52_15385 [Blattella germanica]